MFNADKPACRRKRTRPWAALALVAAAMALAGASAPLAAPAPEVQTLMEAWENTLFQGKKVGFSFMRVDRTQKGYHVTARAALKLTVMGVPQDMSFTSEALLGPDGRMESFSFIQTMQSQRQSMRAVVSQDAVRMTITGAAGSKQTSIKAPAGVTLAHVAEYFFHQDLAMGKEAVYPIFIESLRSVGSLRMKVIGKKAVKADGAQKEAFMVESEMMGMKTTTLVAPDGRKLSGSSLMGISFEAASEEDALKLPGADVPVTSLITFSLITPDKPVENQEKLNMLKVTIRGLSSPDMLTDERQTVGEAIRILDEKGARTFSLPVTIRRIEPLAPVTLAQAASAAPNELLPTPEIQSDHKMIIKVARQIVGGEQDPWNAAKKINKWVYGTLKKEFVDSFTALDVLLTKKGECQSHTNLFVALARASGIPARVSGGIVYSKSNQGFLYHAWPEVYVGRWVAMDPTLGQDVADPTHIKLIEGGVESLMNLMRYITKISISVDGAE